MALFVDGPATLSTTLSTRRVLINSFFKMKSRVYARSIPAAVAQEVARQGVAFVRRRGARYLRRMIERPALARRVAGVPPSQQVQMFRRLKKRLRRATTYRGYLGQPFMGALQTGIDRFTRDGYVLEFESGSVKAGPQSVYAAHGLGPESACLGVCAAVTRRALKKFGINLKSWDVTSVTPNIADEFTWKIHYKVAPTGQVFVQSSVVVAGTLPAATLARRLLDLIMGHYTDIRVFFEVTDIELFWAYNDGVNPPYIKEQYARNTEDLKFEMVVHSRLSVQNRTPAATGAADETNALDVANNPVYGRIYRGKGTVITVRSQNNISASSDFLEFHKDYGFDSIANDETGFPPGLFKPPEHHAFNFCYASSPLNVAPGEIKDDNLVIKKTFTFNKFIIWAAPFLRSALNTAAAQPNTNFNLMFPFHMLAFERKLDTRTGEPPVTIGFETNYKLYCRCTDKPSEVALRDIRVIVPT